ncbi:MAG TPA: hypothetical protein DEA80_03215 [Afipia sp.]|nr:hypothetical protein [Afipia sp.]OUX62091.1 MAG: hypothetical protein CBB64_05810 [Afipia sp. TMED4]HAO42184.1 hypothetical protein [Afipia sp.]HBF56422.1 hypothetical protein [Afipia sp.]HBR43940.1 hypothetical protein [Afipia sp.]
MALRPYIELMQRFIQIVQIIWAAVLVILGGTIGAVVGYGNGGWIGAVCLGAAGTFVGAVIGEVEVANGLSFVLQMLRIF